MKHSEPIGLSLTCMTMLIMTNSENLFLRLGAIVIGTASLILVNKYYINKLAINKQ